MPCLKVQGDEVLVGEDHEPVFLTITYGNPDKVSRGFTKSMTLSEVKLVVMELTGRDLSKCAVSRMVIKGRFNRLLFTFSQCC